MASFGAFQLDLLSRSTDFALGRIYKAPPAAAVLIAGEVYDQVVGTYAAPYTAAANVRSGTDRGDGVLGICVIPVVADVRYGVAIDATVGAAHIPPAGSVLSGVPVEDTVGTYTPPVPDYPAPVDVRDRVLYADDLLEGLLVVPEAINVRQGIVYDAATSGALIARPVPAPTAAVLLLPPPSPLAAGYYNPNPAPPTPRGFRYV